MTATYIGLKKVVAWREGRQGQEGYAVRYADGYQSWSPRATFEEAYLEVRDEFADVILTEAAQALGYIADVGGGVVDDWLNGDDGTAIGLRLSALDLAINSGGPDRDTKSVLDLASAYAAFMRDGVAFPPSLLTADEWAELRVALEQGQFATSTSEPGFGQFARCIGMVDRALGLTTA